MDNHFQRILFIEHFVRFILKLFPTAHQGDVARFICDILRACSQRFALSHHPRQRQLNRLIQKVSNDYI
jgi:hypothetical protein